MTPHPAPAPRPTNTATHTVERFGNLYVYQPIKPAKP